MRAQDLGRFAEENGDVAEALAELSNETAKVGAAIPEEGLDRRYDLGALVFNSTGAALRRAASATSRAAEFSGRVTELSAALERDFGADGENVTVEVPDEVHDLDTDVEDLAARERDAVRAADFISVLLQISLESVLIL